MPSALELLIPDAGGRSLAIAMSEPEAGSALTDLKTRGFLLNASGFSTIDLPPTIVTNFISPRGINAQGDIVGFYRDLANQAHGFLLRR